MKVLVIGDSYGLPRYAKNSFNNNVQEAALNESGEEAKRRGF